MNFYCLIHSTLLWFALISSFLLLVVATENVEYLTTGVVDVIVEEGGNGVTVNGDSATPVVDSLLFKSDNPQEKILPNYKKVKKLNVINDDDNGGAIPSSNILQTENNRREHNFLYVEESADVETIVSSATITEPTFNKAAEMVHEKEILSLSASAPGASEKQKLVTQSSEGNVLSMEGRQLVSDFQYGQENEESFTKEAEEDKKYENNLPDLTEIPTVTSAVHEFTELPQEVLEVNGAGVEAVIINDEAVDVTGKTVEQRRINETVPTNVLPTGNNEEQQKDEQIVKINDSGGDGIISIKSQTADKSSPMESITITSPDKVSAKILQHSLPTANTENITGEQDASQSSVETLSSTLPPAGSAATEAEEVPIPVFSEWAQKQMEAVEKQQQLEQDVVNTSTQRKHNNNNTNGNQKLPPLKLRAKNYASPDCGAKIIASNADATNTGAVLSASKDEYMLSPCTNRIWFVVELCEAIQAQKIDLANFELFSSSPRNFTVAVSNRFPTREWSNVGRFIAEDSRTVQSFDLHPHLFGKFVRVDIHSHYSKEHFCPVSLFRVFGTSEFEAFETENQPNEDLDDFEDEFVLEQAHVKNSENNLFKSASDAVLSIVKKAAEVLAKPASNNNSELAAIYLPDECQTLVAGRINCVDCKSTLVERINEVLSCKARVLSDLLKIQRLKRDLMYSRICANSFGIELIATLNEPTDYSAKELSYFLYLLPLEYIGALCQLLVESQRKLLQPPPLLPTGHPSNNNDDDSDGELALNLTIDQQLKSQTDITFEGAENIQKQKKKLIKTDERNDSINVSSGGTHQMGKVHININEKQQQAAPATHTTTTTTLQSNAAQADQLARPQLELEVTETAKLIVTITTTTTPPPSIVIKAGTVESVVDANHHEDTAGGDINIFNVNIEDNDGGNDDDRNDASPSAEITSAPVKEEKGPMNTNDGMLQPLYEGSADYSHSSITSTEQLSPSVTTSTTTASSTSIEDSSSWDSIDNLLTATTMMPPGVGVATATGGSGVGAGGNQQAASINIGTTVAGSAGVVGVGVNMQQKIPNGGPHTESIFIRLSNRIKALELNMSLSGQYLEELSRRYKKQVEELQHTLTQQTLHVRTLEEQNRKHTTYEELLSQHNLQLKNELDELTLQVHACIVVIIFVGAFVFLVIMIGILFVRSLRRETRELVLLQKDNGAVSKTKHPTAANAHRCKSSMLARRKSFEDFSDHQNINKSGENEKLRRPSEEAMLIIKKSGSDKSCDGISNTMKDHVGDIGSENKSRQRKMSICYGSIQKNDINHNVNTNGNVLGIKQSITNGEMETEERNLEKLQALEEFDKFSESDTNLPNHDLFNDRTSKLYQWQNTSGLKNGNCNGSSVDGQKNKLSKKHLQNVKRQISAPGNMSNRDYSRNPKVDTLDTSDLVQIIGNSSDYDDSLMLDEDGLDNFLPGADLAYNEFMPEGPSGYQIQMGVPTPTTNAPSTETTNMFNKNSNSNQKNNHHQHEVEIVVEKSPSVQASKKSGRRLSSPAFFKSPFSKSLKFKTNTNSSASTPPHESTSWEWYRSKKIDKLHSALAKTNAEATETTITTTTTTAAPLLSSTSCVASRISNPMLQITTTPNVCNHQQHRQRNSPMASIDSLSLSEINFPTNSNENSFRMLEEAILPSATLNANSNNLNGVVRGGGGSSSSSGGNSSIRSTSTRSSTKKKKSHGFNKIFKKVF